MRLLSEAKTKFLRVCIRIPSTLTSWSLSKCLDNAIFLHLFDEMDFHFNYGRLKCMKCSCEHLESINLFHPPVPRAFRIVLHEAILAEAVHL